jgi:hypothetical protein
MLIVACSDRSTPPKPVSEDASAPSRRASGDGQPIIDVHLHTPTAAKGPPDSAENQALRKKIFGASKHAGTVVALLSGTHDFVASWLDEAGIRLLPGVIFPCPDGKNPSSDRQCFPGGEVFPPIDWLKSLHAAGKLAFLGEVTAQYAGIAPDDPRMEPYYALAEDLDIPIAIHLGFTKAGAPYDDCGLPRCPKAYRMPLGNPLLLEPVLLRHPKLRVLVAHAGWPFGDDMIALLYMHPRVYVDLARVQKGPGRSAYQTHLRRLVDAGFGKRILFGSDVFDEHVDVLAQGLAALEEATFLTYEQKRDILYNNARAFLRLDEK